LGLLPLRCVPLEFCCLSFTWPLVQCCSAMKHMSATRQPQTSAVKR
jgi:hypothetical protein